MRRRGQARWVGRFRVGRVERCFGLISREVGEEMGARVRMEWGRLAEDRGLINSKMVKGSPEFIFILRME